MNAFEVIMNLRNVRLEALEEARTKQLDAIAGLSERGAEVLYNNGEVVFFDLRFDDAPTVNMLFKGEESLLRLESGVWIVTVIDGPRSDLKTYLKPYLEEVLTEALLKYNLIRNLTKDLSDGKRE